ncbi:MAG TPA: 4Fe-4S dicluster domain-containing protein, partial [Bryobacteraceae bacterium]|nr:4Fe-4S dicluster domain-containing protein [Bryobacteraceae bacterium]
VGWGDEQESGHYRLKRREDNAVFGYTVGPQGWKRFLHPPEVPLLEAQRDNSSFRILKKPPAPVRYAFLGVRACELAAIRILDRVFLGDRYVEPGYKGRREAAFLIAVNCTKAGGTCFCTSMGTGPRAASGFDLALTELPGREGHRFVVEVGSEAGAAVLGEIEHRKAREEEVREAQAAVDNAAGQMRRAVDTEGIRDVLFDNFEHPRWDRVAARCLSCANCTMVCPTCFCTTVEDVTDIAGDRAERWRKWDSCFTDGFSYIHGGSVRLSVKSRYRQWLTHKFAAWVDQFGTFGCVGCGRCITWCPGRIDITEELRAMRGVEASA